MSHRDHLGAEHFMLPVNSIHPRSFTYGVFTLTSQGRILCATLEIHLHYLVSAHRMSPSVSSIQTVREIPLAPCGISDAKEDLNELIQFPEGGTTAWCTVIGG